MNIHSNIANIVTINKHVVHDISFTMITIACY